MAALAEGKLDPVGLTNRLIRALGFQGIDVADLSHADVTELDADLVRRKIATISRNLDALSAVDGVTLAAYPSELYRKKGTERLLQEAVEAAVDTNDEIVLKAVSKARRSLREYVVPVERYVTKDSH